MDNSRMGCINRDKMDAKNIQNCSIHIWRKEKFFEVSERLQSQQDITTTSQIA
jgi:hypothetical protein